MSETMSDYLQQLNEVQRKAVTTTEGPVLVVAGPGSGKTRVLTFRIAYLIQQGVAPWEILSLTFTNKAAREMSERISKVVGNKANQVFSGTFHSIFARILRAEAEKLGYPSNFTIYDSDDTKSLIGTIIKDLNLDKNAYQANNVRSRISSAKSNLIPPKLYEGRADLMEEDRLRKTPHFYKIYTEYMARCKRSGAMDFDDLLYRMYELLHKDQEAREKYQKRFRYVLVDEFQDTNFLQYAIVKKLVDYPGSPYNICAVGDDAQSIYGFRGATIQNILDFEKDFQKKGSQGIQVFKLEQNYRSTDHIVQAANEVITFNKKQIQKTIWSDKGEGQKIKVIKAMSDNEEGKRIADTILEQKNRFHLSNSDIAILYRTNAQSRVFEENLRKYNVAYKVFGGLSFYQRKEVKDLIAYLRLAINPKDEEAFRRVVNYPRRGIGGTTIDKLSSLAVEQQSTMWEVLDYLDVSGKAKNNLLDFKKMIIEFGKKAQTSNAYEVASFVTRQSGLLDTLKTDTSIEGLSRIENVNALLDGINEFVENDVVVEGEEASDKSLSTYLQNIALLTDFDQAEEEQDFVTLMSVHSAKGLEFKSVFVVGLEENLFPSFMSMDSAEGLDEERRLFYVAVTRAELFLTLSFANSRYHYGNIRYNQPSRFLEEISANHLDSNASVNSFSQPGFARTDWQTQFFENSKGKGEKSLSKVAGNFAKSSRSSQQATNVNVADFKPSPTSEIAVGQKVLHLKFGEGRVTKVDGGAGNPVATIVFDNIDQPEKRIALRFAKLQILE
ncbi:MAG: UvrD-helicase domain-containing protein [Saprospiraceae bacterium]